MDHKIFLSWSGDAGSQAAEAFSEALHTHFHTRCFLSRNMPIGAEWAKELAAALRECTFCLVFVTPSSVRSPWVLWEAGALWKSHAEENRVCPVLLCVPSNDVPAPLKLFQMKELTVADAAIPDGSGAKDQDADRIEPLEERCKEILRGVFSRLDMSDSRVFEARFSAAWQLLKRKLPAAVALARAESQNPWLDELRELSDEITRLHERLRIVCDAVEGPAYFMDDKYDIIFTNLAAKVFFEFHAPPAMPFEEFWAAVAPRIENREQVEANMRDNFQNPRKRPPPVDFETIKYRHPDYGLIMIRKIGVALPSRDERRRPDGWVVVFNLESIERVDKYYEDHRLAVRARSASAPPNAAAAPVDVTKTWRQIQM